MQRMAQLQCLMTILGHLLSATPQGNHSAGSAPCSQESSAGHGREQEMSTWRSKGCGGKCISVQESHQRGWRLCSSHDLLFRTSQALARHGGWGGSRVTSDSIRGVGQALQQRWGGDSKAAEPVGAKVHSVLDS